MPKLTEEEIIKIQPSDTYELTLGSFQSKIVVAPGEKTCLDCGETTTRDFCPRCAQDDEEIEDDGETPVSKKREYRLVPTTSYLNEWEYRIEGPVRRAHDPKPINKKEQMFMNRIKGSIKDDNTKSAGSARSVRLEFAKIRKESTRNSRSARLVGQR